jgi:hypothetical protein
VLIERRIHLIGGQKVTLDADVAELYQIEMFNLTKQSSATLTGSPRTSWPRKPNL